MRATERLARRIESDRQRGARFKERQKAEGKRQVLLWLTDEQLSALHLFQKLEGFPNRSEAIAAAIMKAAKPTMQTS